ALTEQHRYVDVTALRDLPLRTVLREERVQVDGAGDAAVRPCAHGRGLGEALQHRLRQRVRAGSGQRGVPLGLGDAGRREGGLQVVPGDLRREGVEDLLVLVRDLAECADELVAAAVGAPDRTDPRVALAVLHYPV